MNREKIMAATRMILEAIGGTRPRRASRHPTTCGRLVRRGVRGDAGDPREHLAVACRVICPSKKIVWLPPKRLNPMPNAVGIFARSVQTLEKP